MEYVQEIVQFTMEKNADYTASLALFTDVSNSKELRELIVHGKLEAALLNASMVMCRPLSDNSICSYVCTKITVVLNVLMFHF